MAYCKKCNALIEDGEKFCPSCYKEMSENEFADNYFDNLFSDVTTDENGSLMDNGESVFGDAELGDISMLEKIFDNFVQEAENSEMDMEIDDGSSMDIEALIEEGNKYSQEIKKQLETPPVDNEYDEHGRYIPNMEESQDIIENSTEEGLLDFMNDFIDNNMQVAASTDEGLSLDDLGFLENEDVDIEQLVSGNDEFNIEQLVAATDDIDIDQLVAGVDELDIEQLVGDEDIENNISDEQELSTIGTEPDNENDKGTKENKKAKKEKVKKEKIKKEKVKKERKKKEDSTDEEAEEKGIIEKVFANVEEKETSKKGKAVKPELTPEEIAEAKEEKKKQKQAKAEEKKAQKQKKLEEKKAKKAQKQNDFVLEEEEPKGRINPIGSTIIFVLAAGLCAFLIIFVTKFDYFISIKSCEKYYEQGQYEYAYEQISGMELKEKDEHLNEELRILLHVDKFICDSENFMEIGYYDKAANSLIIAAGNYDEYYANAKDADIEDEYKKLNKEIYKKLKDDFGISKDAAKELMAISDSALYSEKLRGYTKKLYLD